MHSTMKVFHILFTVLTVLAASLSLGCAKSKQQKGQDLVKEYNKSQVEILVTNRVLKEIYRVILYSPDDDFDMEFYIKNFNWGQTKDTDRARVKEMLNIQLMRVARIAEIISIEDLNLAVLSPELKTLAINAQKYLGSVEQYEKGRLPKDPRDPRNPPKKPRKPNGSLPSESNAEAATVSRKASAKKSRLVAQKAPQTSEALRP